MEGVVIVQANEVIENDNATAINPVLSDYDQDASEIVKLENL